MKIKRRSVLIDSTGSHFVAYLHRERAATQLASGEIIADEMRNGEIWSFRLAGLAPLSIRAGSFGVRRERIPVNHQYGLSGGIVFSPNKTYEELATA